MFKHYSTQITAACILCAAAVSAQTAAQKEEYQEFADLMDANGYSWEPHTITTDDGYILTTFHILENLNKTVIKNPDLVPVLLMHGQQCDATSWLSWNPEDEPLAPIPLQLFDDGFDVWMASNRGTKYCHEHTTLDWHDKEYWAWSWAEMGIYDDVANIKMIKEQTGKEKVSYVGVSQGTVQMFYALSKVEDSFLADNLFTFAALDPCTIQVNEGSHIYEDGLFFWEDYGVYNVAGPHWHKNLKTICDNFDEEICEYAKGCSGGEPYSVQALVHWAQNDIVERFQEYAPKYNEGETITDLIPLDSIDKVPITMWSGMQDQICSHQQALTTRDTIGERVTKMVSVPWASHGWWGGKLAEPLYFMLRETLINPERKSYDINKIASPF